MPLELFKGHCECHANQFNLTNVPIARFNCHCLVCQEFTGKPYSDVSVFLRKDLELINIKNTKFNRYKLPPNIRRGKCKVCKKPSLEMGILGQLVIVPSVNIEQNPQFPQASMHIFYHRRVNDVDDNLPKYEGFLLSQKKVSLAILQGALKNIFK